jgi:HAD superfamily hydrolase (TIGR01509 family)
MDMKYDAFLFDLDGTLINTQIVDYVIHRDLLAELGYELQINTYAAVFGHTRPAMIQGLLRHVKEPISVEEYSARYVPRLEESVRERSDLLVLHADAFLHAAHLRNIPLALVTSSPRNVLQHIAAIEHLLPLFRVVITKDDVTNPKPHPEPFLKAAEKLGAKNPFIFEDSLPGGLSANRAGFPFAIHKHAANHSAARVMETMEHIQFEFDDYANPQVQALLTD